MPSHVLQVLSRTPRPLQVLGEDFLLVEYCGMYQIHLYVFVRASHAHHVSKIAFSKVPTFRALTLSLTLTLHLTLTLCR